MSGDRTIDLSKFEVSTAVHMASGDVLVCVKFPEPIDTLNVYPEHARIIGSAFLRAADVAEQRQKQRGRG